MIAIGIDTGGTCTDAVVFDTETHKILSQYKTLTTKWDLKEGILKALKGLEPKQLSGAAYISLSTTLATNACVEGKGGRAKLVFIGVKPPAVAKMRGEYGLPPLDEICFLSGDPLHPDEPEPDWDAFRAEMKDEFAGFDSAAVVQVNPKYNDGEYELIAARMIREELGVPCVRGYELYQELNVQKRGATALLNARLLPVMEEFFDSVERSLLDMGIDLPVVIVRSDGSIMSREFAMQRPVETLLCGPAASIIGAMELSRYTDALIVDMGGTTSDIAMVRDRKPVAAASGISIGEWKTMVKGVSIDTFSLGGDTRVLYKGRELALDQRRAVPLCMLASWYPEVTKKLKTLVHMDQAFSYPAHEFLLLVNRPQSTLNYTAVEKRLLDALEKGPLMYREAAEAARVSPHVFSAGRLEDEGIVIRCGVTPTCVMHVTGDFCAYDSEASMLGIQYLATVVKSSAEEVCAEIYELVKRRLFDQVVRIFMQYETGRDLNEQEREDLQKLTSFIFTQEKSKSGDAFIQPLFRAPSKLIGIGAPTRIFLGKVAELLQTEVDFPADGKVANAIGAAVGNVSTECKVRIEPYKGIKSSYLTYVVTGGAKTFSLPDYQEALAEGKKIAREQVLQRARQQGASGHVEVKIEVEENTYRRERRRTEELIETVITASAVSEER